MVRSSSSLFRRLASFLPVLAVAGCAAPSGSVVAGGAAVLRLPHRHCLPLFGGQERVLQHPPRRGGGRAIRARRDRRSRRSGRETPNKSFERTAEAATTPGALLPSNFKLLAGETPWKAIPGAVCLSF